MSEANKLKIDSSGSIVRENASNKNVISSRIPQEVNVFGFVLEFKVFMVILATVLFFFRFIGCKYHYTRWSFTVFYKPIFISMWPFYKSLMLAPGIYHLVLFFFLLLGLHRLFNRDSSSGTRSASRKVLRGMKDIPKDPPKGGWCV